MIIISRAEARARSVTMPDEASLRKLYGSLFRIWPDGSPVVDANLASVLGLSSLPYTSNDNDAQLLLPTGWTWTGVSSCVRTADSATLNRNIYCTLDGPQPSDALRRCITAIQARISDLIPVSPVMF
jgi:hypothetical protein